MSMFFCMAAIPICAFAAVTFIFAGRWLEASLEATLVAVNMAVIHWWFEQQPSRSHIDEH